LADGATGRLVAHCKKSACGFTDILAAAGLRPGDYAAPDPLTLARREAEMKADALRRAMAAEKIWREAEPIGGTLAETYLQSRGIDCPLPKTLRFHGACWHGATRQAWPAMIALIEGGEGYAVHRTYLRPDGQGKASVEPAKAMLGAAAGGAVRLTDGPSRLVIGEGIESTLSLACGLLDGPATLWAGLSTSGMRGLRLPANPGSLTVACDGDRPGREAAHALAGRAHGLGWRVEMLDPGAARDFNDVLMQRRVAA